MDTLDSDLDDNIQQDAEAASLEGIPDDASDLSDVADALMEKTLRDEDFRRQVADAIDERVDAPPLLESVDGAAYRFVLRTVAEIIPEKL